MRIRLTAAAEATDVRADVARRRITGTLVPFGHVGRPSIGPDRIRFDADARLTVAPGMVLNLEHEQARPIGRAVHTTATPEALTATFAVAHTSAGSDALTEAAEGLRSGLSIEATDVEGEWTEDADGPVFAITAANIEEAALVRRPAFHAAAVTDVAATAATPNREANTMTEASEATAVAEAPADVPMTGIIARVAGGPPMDTEAPAPEPVPAVRASGPIYAPTPTAPTPGEYVLAALSRDPSRMSDMTRRIRAAAPHTFVADIPGLIPEAIVGPVLHYGGASPLFDALGRLTAPAGDSFKVPYVDPSLAVAAAGTEKSDVTDQIGVAAATVNMVFVKRAVNISAEAIAYSQPSIIDVAVQELSDSLALGSELVITSALEAVTGTNTPVVLAADGSDVWAKMAAAVSAHYAACGRRPDVFTMAPDVWAAVAGMTDSKSGAPIVAGVGQNLNGSDWGSAFGIPIVVSDQITAGKGFLVDRAGVKSWQGARIDMRIQEPTILGYSIGGGRATGLSVVGGNHVTPVSVGV